MRFWNRVIWEQMGGAIDALAKVVETCPDSLWSDHGRARPFWGEVHHVTFWLDLYLTGDVDEYCPPDGIGLEELDPEGVLPAIPLSKERAASWVGRSRLKAMEVTLSLTEERAEAICTFGWGSMPFGELLLYNLRHVQHHVGQLNRVLRQEADDAAEWSFAARGRPPRMD